MKTIKLTNSERHMLATLIPMLYAEAGYSDVSFNELYDELHKDYKLKGVNYWKGVLGSLCNKGVLHVIEGRDMGITDDIIYLHSDYYGLHKSWREEVECEEVEVIAVGNEPRPEDQPKKTAIQKMKTGTLAKKAKEMLDQFIDNKVIEEDTNETLKAIADDFISLVSDYMFVDNLEEDNNRFNYKDMDERVETEHFYDDVCDRQRMRMIEKLSTLRRTFRRSK